MTHNTAHASSFWFGKILGRLLWSIPIFVLVAPLIWGTAGAQGAEEEIQITYPEGTQAESFWPDASLQKRLTGYWKERFSKPSAEDLIQYEAPHFEFMVPSKRYKAFLRNWPDGEVTQIRLVRLEKVTEKYIELPMYIHYIDTSGEERSFGLKDRWVRVRGTWYHLQRDPLIFPGVSLGPKGGENLFASA